MRYDQEHIDMPEDYKPKREPRHWMPSSGTILAYLLILAVLIGIGIAVGQLYSSGHEILK